MDLLIQFLNAHWAEISAFMALIGALAKSERLALDPSTQANGILHGRKLSKDALAIPMVPAGKN